MRLVEVEGDPRAGEVLVLREGLKLSIGSIERHECHTNGAGVRPPKIDLYCAKHKDLDTVRTCGLWTKLEDAATVSIPPAPTPSSAV